MAAASNNQAGQRVIGIVDLAVREQCASSFAASRSRNLPFTIFADQLYAIVLPSRYAMRSCKSSGGRMGDTSNGGEPKAH